MEERDSEAVFVIDKALLIWLKGIKGEKYG